jgi:hypothetical protein
MIPAGFPVTFQGREARTLPGLKLGNGAGANVPD